jgi:hypothetical protein
LKSTGTVKTGLPAQILKSPYIGLKCPEHFSKEPPNLRFKAKNSLSWQPLCKQMSLARPGDFSPYKSSLKTNVDTLSADFLYGEKILCYGEKFSRRTGTLQ